MPTDRFRCVRCGVPPEGYVYAGDTPECPKCGHCQTIQLCDIHLLVADRKGPIMGLYRQYVACEPDRDGLATHMHDDYSATIDPRVVTCPSCQGTDIWKQMAKFHTTFDRNWKQKFLKMQQTGAIKI